ADAATALGIGQEQPAGLDAFMGSVDPDDTGVEHAAAMMGQGRVLTSPLSMAVVLASVQGGETVAPRILADQQPATPEVPAPLTAEETAQMQEMLRGVVTDGSLDEFADLPGEPVIGKTGTAEWTDEDGELALHSWVIVAQGDLVVAAFVEDGSYGSVTAGPIAREVLEGSCAGWIGAVVHAGLDRAPRLEGGERLLVAELRRRQPPAEHGRVEEVVDRRVVEARTGRVVPPGGEDHAVDACPQCGGQAHRARLAAGVQHRAAQLVAAGQPARLTDRHDLGVRGRVVGCGDPVDALDDA